MTAYSHAATAREELTDYMKLIQKFPLRPTRDESQFNAASEMLDHLLDLEEISTGQQDYLDVLGGLSREFEHDREPMPDASPNEVLKFLMEQHGMRQADLVQIIGSKSLVSEILSGKRQLNLRHIRAISRHFHVSTDAFIDEH